MINQQIGPREDYNNLQINISKPSNTAKRFTVQMHITGWRYFDPAEFRFKSAELLALSADPNTYGQALGKAFFSEQCIGDPYSETLAAIQARGDGLRVQLILDSPELQELHWERIFHPIAGAWQPVGSTAVTPFSRFIRPQQWDRPTAITTRPLRILVVIASPANLESDFQLHPIAAEERLKLHTMFDQIPDLATTYLESGTANPPTLNAIRQHLADGYHLVHFLCHGAHTSAGIGLFLEDPDGQVDPVEQNRLISAFKVLKTPPVFCFLAACESAKQERHDAFLPLGPSLVGEGGLQAVVAMTGKVGLPLAQQFAGQFYVRLLKHGVVDLAMNEARALVQDDWDWGVPVLFTRLQDNQLIDFPIGKMYERYLSHTDTAFLAVDEVLSNARLEDHGGRLADDLQELVNELSKSHGVQVEVASKFRRTGRDPQNFAQKFEGFYYDFKDYYDNQTWVSENTSCTRIDALKAEILPKLSPLLSPANFSLLEEELNMLSNADADLLRYFNEYISIMNAAVEEIWAALESDNIESAIQIKRDFEAQISPSFQRSKAMFERMSHNIRGVQAA
ncbi:MAG: hypothetical protein CVU39_19185 [Chloroflexi bacterium HGW-Chloroflexi-10]|nr:MAG: hypothetical protein CVU39_19185 [Chloroflexi bacterium HGW-Chloroflexi-10]